MWCHKCHEQRQEVQKAASLKSILVKLVQLRFPVTSLEILIHGISPPPPKQNQVNVTNGTVWLVSTGTLTKDIVLRDMGEAQTCMLNVSSFREARRKRETSGSLWADPDISISNTRVPLPFCQPLRRFHQSHPQVGNEETEAQVSHCLSQSQACQAVARWEKYVLSIVTMILCSIKKLRRPITL